MTSISACFDCRKWADKITEFSKKTQTVAQLELGRWARRRRHDEVHEALRKMAEAVEKAEKSASLDQWALEYSHNFGESQ